MSALAHTIEITVPDTKEAVGWFRRVTGVPEGQGSRIFLPPNIEVQFRQVTGGKMNPPRITDLGANHLCFRSDAIEKTAEFLDNLPDTEVLGEIITVPEGPLQGNRWVYFRSPWGVLFELQQWPTVE